MKPSDLLSADETLFRDQEAFNPDYIPDQFNFRDAQLKEMSLCIKPAFRKGRPSSAFLIGPPGTGKTTSVKIVFGQLKESTSKVVPVYINCHLQSSTYKIFYEIRRAIFGLPPPDSGIPAARIQDEVFAELAKKSKALVVCLDEINYLLADGVADEALYTILRAHEVYPGSRTAVFAIATEEMLHRLNDRVRSIFSPVRIEYRPYAGQEMLEILKARRDAGLYPDVLSDELLGRIAFETRDLRFGIELLKQSAMAAESDASRKIELSHVEKAERSIHPPEASQDKMLVLSLVREKGPLESGKLFGLAKERMDISYASFYRMLRRLHAGGFIEIDSVAASGSERGRTSLIRAK